MPTKPKVLLSHPTGNANVRQILKLLHEEEALAGFATSIYWEESAAWHPLLPSSVRRQFERRRFDVDKQRVLTNAFPEIIRQLNSKINWPYLNKRFSVDAIYDSLDRKVARSLSSLQPDTVYCYEDGAENTFERAKELGVRCVYDLPIAFWKTSFRLMAEESERLPRWAKTMTIRNDSEAKRARKDREISMADNIICPSQFVYDSLPESIRENTDCTIARFGCFNESGYRSRPTPKDEPLRVLFVGSMTQRKGLADIFEAFKAVKRKDLQLVVLGSLCEESSFYKNEYGDFQYEAPRPHGDVLKLMASCDLFILPSLVEGRALVQLEALGVGLPLIITANTGGDDLIGPDNETGFIVPIRSPEAIAERLNWFAENRDLIDDMKAACLVHASKLSWETYRRNVADAILS